MYLEIEVVLYFVVRILMTVYFSINNNLFDIYLEVVHYQKAQKVQKVKHF